MKERAFRRRGPKSEGYAKSSLLTLLSWFSVLAVLGFLAVMGVAFDWSMLHLKAAEWTHAWWLVPVLVLAQAVPFALALPGSLMFVVIGLLYDPVPATAMITTGGVLGSLAAFHLAQRFTFSWVRQIQRQKVYLILRRNTNFLMLCALRILPGFPHSVINYGSGLLDIPLNRFVLSAALGYMVKGLLYASLLHNVVDADEAGELLTLEGMWPLIVLGLLFIASFVAQKLFSRSRTGQERE